MAVKSFSFPADAVDAQQATCQLLVPFMGYQLRFFNQLLEQLGEVSHFILVAAANDQALSDFLPKLGLTTDQLQNLLQRLQQLNLLNSSQKLTLDGQAAATFLIRGLHGKTTTLWFEQTYKPGAGNMPPQILREASALHERDFWPSTWPERKVFTGRSSTQMQTQALHARLQRLAKSQAQGDRLKQAHQTLFVELFPEAQGFVEAYPHWTLSVELQPLQQEAVRYFALNLPLPGDSPVWAPAQAEKNRESAYLWPRVEARITYRHATGLSSAGCKAPEVWQYHWCAHTGRNLKVEALQAQADTALTDNAGDWLERLKISMPEEKAAHKLMSRQITFTKGLTPWQLEEQQLHQYLTNALDRACLTL